VKIEGVLFAIGTVFFAVVTIFYWVLSGEVIGTTVLGLTGALAFLIGFYLLYTGRRVGARPEDRPDALISEADPDYGFFSPTSWWPLPVGFATALVALGLIFAVWLLILGVALLLLALVGFYFEYYRGAWAE
jgi:cytochrome c oxidase subunit IV